MNKQEAIEKIKGKTEYFKVKKEYDRGFRDGLNSSIPVIREIDEPEKPVVPQYVADWIEWCKRNSVTLLGAMSPIDELGTAICNDKKVKSLDAFKWATQNQETFAKAWLFGYEVEKEKLYTVKFSNEDFGKFYIGIFKAVNKFGISSLPLNDDDVKSWFTKDELERFKFWDNPAFEIKEVKKEEE